MAVVTEVEGTKSLLPVLQEGKPDARGWLVRRSVFAGFWVALGIVALALGPSEAIQLTRAFTYVIVGFSINILIGYAGQVSLGHAAFFGVGAFTSALFVKQSGSRFWIAFILAMATGAIAALLLGLVALRLKGLYLALVTLAYGTITEVVIFGIPAVTGGGAGVQTVRPPGFVDDNFYALLCLAFVGLIFFVDTRFVRSKAGRGIFAIQENEVVAASFGINVVAYKLLAFVISGAMAGLAGCLFAHQIQGGSIAPGDFKFELSLTFILMVVVGGLRSRGGIFIASAFFALLGFIIDKLHTPMDWLAEREWPVLGKILEIFFGTEGRPFLPIFIGAVLLLVTLIQFPGGIGQPIRPVTDWLRGEPFTFKKHSGGIQAGGAGVRP